MPESMTLRVEVSLYGQNGTRLGINETVEMDGMDFGQLSRLLEAFHMIADAVKNGQNVNVNGADIIGGK